jgi:hypothetical protein
VNSYTAAREPPLTYTRLVFGWKAMPSQASGTGVRPTTRPLEDSITVADGGRYPQLSTRRYLPSGESAEASGSVSTGTWRPTGFSRQKLFSRKLPSGRGPTCSRGAGWENTKAANTGIAANRRMRRMGDFIRMFPLYRRVEGGTDDQLLSSVRRP